MTAVSRRGVLLGGASLAAAGALGAAGPLTTADASPGSKGRHPISSARIHRWARDTWACLVAMTDEKTGLTADNLDGPLAQRNRSGYTSPTNIGGYLWSAVVARDLGMISRRECSSRIDQTLRTLGKLEHHRPSGMFYNWYDEATGKKLTSWPVNRRHRLPVPVQRRQRLAGRGLHAGAERRSGQPSSAEVALRPMNFAAFYNQTARTDTNRGPNVVRGLMQRWVLGASQAG